MIFLYSLWHLHTSKAFKQWVQQVGKEFLFQIKKNFLSMLLDKLSTYTRKTHQICFNKLRLLPLMLGTSQSL